MFDWFKKKSSILSKWDLPDTTDLKLIQNPDSIQYTNEDESRVIYFSILNVSGKGVLSMDLYTDKLTITEAANGWQLKGTKKFEDQILVCVISVHKQGDIEWAEMFFNAIKPR